MTNLKVNKESLQEIQQELYDIRHTAFTSYYTDVKNFKESASAQATAWENSGSKWQNLRSEAKKSVKLSDFKKSWSEQTFSEKINLVADYNYTAYYDKIDEVARNIFKQKIADYRALNDNLTNGFQDSYSKTICKVVNGLGKLIRTINAFEENPVNDIDSYLSADYVNRNISNLAFVAETFTSEDGEELKVSALKLKSEDGGIHDIDENVNCLYAKSVGSAKTVVVAAVSAANSKEYQALKTDEARRAYIDQVIGQTVEDTNETYDNWYQKGYFAATTDDELAELYEDLTGMEYDKDAINEHLDAYIHKFGFEDDAEFEKWLLSGAGSVLTPFMVNKALEQNGPLTDDELKEMGLDDVVEGREKIGKSVTLEEPEEKDLPSLGEAGGDGSSLEAGDNSNGLESELESEPTPIPGDKALEDLEPPTDPDVKDPTEGVVPDDRTYDITEDPIPEPPGLDEKMDNATIDKLAEERFYEQYTPEQLADYRGKQVDEFNDLFSSDDKSELVDFYNGAGYDLNEAKILADNKELGLAAFLAAKQSADMADLSRSIAQSANMDMTMFDTRFDNGASYSDLVSGDTNAFLANPNGDPNVSSAKQVMNSAKAQYDKAVDTANKSIDQANNNKDKLESVKKGIVKKSGNDSSKWSDEDIEKYNDAVNEYNDSVKQANEDVSAAQNAKTEYDNSKAEYENSKDEYYEQVKEETLKNREISESGEVPSDTPESNVPENGGNGAGSGPGSGVGSGSGSGSNNDLIPDVPGGNGSSSGSNNDLIPDLPDGNGSSGNSDLIPDIPGGNSNNPGTDDSGMGFGKPESGTGNSGNSESFGFAQNNSSGPSDNNTPNDDYVGVDESSSGLGFRSGSESGSTETNYSQNDDNSEYIYIDDNVNPMIDENEDDSGPKASSNGIGF